MRDLGSFAVDPLEEAIRSLPAFRAPDPLRAALRRDLLTAAAARRTTRPLPFLGAIGRVAFAAATAILLAMSGWAIAASAPGDLVFPVKEMLIRLVLPSASEETRSPVAPELFTPSADPTPARTPDGSEPPAGSTLPGPRPLVSAPPIVPAIPADATIAPEPSTTERAAPAAATPAVPPVPPGPRATPAVPPPHR